MNENVFLTYDAIVIGTGAAGYNAAIRIAKDGCDDQPGRRFQLQ